MSEKNQISLNTVIAEAIKKGLIVFDPITDQYILKEEEFPLSLGFENVAMSQGKNICVSRSDASIKSEVMRGVFLDIPLIAANMSTVTNAGFCIQLSKLGALGVLHRAASQEHILSEVTKIKQSNCPWIAAAIGTGEDQFDFTRKLVEAGMNIVVIDIANGYCDTVINLGKKIRKEFKDLKIVAGNTSNTNMLYEVDCFADAVKFGLANGSACETKNTAGCNEKQFSTVYNSRKVSKELGLPIISDGGTKEPADFAKALFAGANSVMAGGIFARCPESAAEIVEIDGVFKKVYAGMASRKVQTEWRGGLKAGTCPEGKTVYLNIGESVEALLERYSGALRSAITYVGANNIQDAQKMVKFVRFVG